MRNKELAKQTAAALGAGAIKKRKGVAPPIMPLPTRAEVEAQSINLSGFPQDG